MSRNISLTLFAQFDWLRWIVGTDPDQAGTPRLQWLNLPESWGVFVLIAIVAALVFGVFWLYRNELNTCPSSVKKLMAALRLAVLLLLVAMYLKPSIFYQQVNEIKPTIAVLRDRSLSFGQADKYPSESIAAQLAATTGLEPQQLADGSVSRVDLVNRVFDSQPDLLKQLRQKASVKVVDFATDNQPTGLIPALGRDDLEVNDDPETTDNGEGSKESSDSVNPPDPTRKTMPPLVANGLGTDLAQALQGVLDDGDEPSAILLVTDGQHNGSKDPREIAARAGELGVPIYAVGVGDPRPPKNLAVTEVYVRERAYPNEPFEVESVLQTTDREQTQLPSQVEVRLLQQSVDARSGKLLDPQIIQSVNADVPDQGGRVRVNFDHVLDQPGQYIYTVQVEAVEDEIELADNARSSAQLEVVDDQVKVLLISGLPSWDYQQVQRLLQRDSTISLSCWLQSMDETRPQEGDDPISRLPRSIEELGQYNLVIMMDPNPQEFDRSWINLLKDYCRYKAGGLLFVCGPQFTGEFVTMNRLRDIRQLLPVRLGDNEFIDSIQALASATDNQAGQMLPVSHNLDHPAMSFRSDAAQTEQIWNSLPGVYWNFPAIAAKPTARVLLERGDQVNSEGNQPLLVDGRYGSGTVMYMGFQDTWRWRSVGVQAQYFDRFWIQTVRYLVENRSLQGSRRGFIDAEKNEFELGDRVTLIGRVLDASFKPLTASSVEANVRSEDGRLQTVEMKLLPQQEGRYEAVFVAQRTGNYQATINIPNANEEDDMIEPVSFRVVPPNAESGAWWLNEKLLTEVAERSGGQYVSLARISELPDKLPASSRRVELNSPPKPFWDINSTLRWLTLGLPVVLLSIEWILRKAYKLL
jgi:hypothetical protein